MGVAGDPATKGVGDARHFVEVADAHAIDARNGGTQSLSGGAQHVYVGILLRLIIEAGAGVHFDLLRFRVAAKGLDHLRPKHACRANLGDLHKEVWTDREAETYLLGSVVDRQATLNHCA